MEQDLDNSNNRMMYSLTFWIRLVGDSLHSFMGVVAISNYTIKYLPVEILTREQTNNARITMMKLSRGKGERESGGRGEKKNRMRRVCICVVAMCTHYLL